MERMIVNLSDVDITDTPDFAEYTTFKEELDFELQNRDFIRTYLPPEAKAQNEALNATLQRVPPQALKQKADELINVQGLNGKYDDLFELMMSKSNGNFAQFNQMWSPILWQARENNSQANVTINQDIHKVYDVDYSIAESLMHLYSSEDPKAEYHEWIEQQKQIEININTCGTTEEEIVERNAFIDLLNDRETEMKRVMTLYAGAAFNSNCRQQVAAQEKLKFLTFKLSELRRLRERTNSTKSHADTKEYFERKERQEQHAAYAATAGFVAMGVAAEMANLGEQRLREKIDTAALEQGVGQTLLQQRPLTYTREEAKAKINTVEQNRYSMRAMFEAMRNGMSKDEWLRSQADKNIGDEIRRKVRNRLGFNVSRYNEYTNSLSA